MKKTTQEAPDCNFFWSMYPFKEGAFVKLYAQGHMPRYGSIRKPEDAEIKFIENTIGKKLTLVNLRLFLKSKCKFQIVDDLAWQEIVEALKDYNNDHPEEYSRPLGLKDWAAIFDVGKNKMRDWLKDSTKYQFKQVSDRKWKLLKKDIPAEYLEKYRKATS